MIQQLSGKYQQLSATFLLAVCFNGMILPARAYSKVAAPTSVYHSGGSGINSNREKLPTATDAAMPAKTETAASKPAKVNKIEKNDIGGPNQPEMTAFKPVGADNLVNLFTGDFSYNIPLMDVGGYPVNIFYDGGVSMEQDASWVGLGWNINPGTVSRNMRGIPDDFNGSEKLTQTQMMKPNINWGVNLGGNLEGVGLDVLSLGVTLGVSFNNYLGPALETGVSGGASLSIVKSSVPEKSALSAGVSLGVNASSRSGVTFSPGLSLTASAHASDGKSSLGFGLRAATSYNSRTGVKAIQLSEQMSYNYDRERKVKNEKGETVTQKLHGGSMNGNMASTSISFAKPSYTPSMRMTVTNKAFSGRFQLGGAIFGIYGSGEIEVYKQKSQVTEADRIQKKNMVGYFFMENAKKDANAMMDFSRFNDNEVTPSTTIISAPQYAYDVFSIQGEGTGGSVRAYRNDEGYVKDNFTLSRDESVNFGGDVGIPGHYGGNFNQVITPSIIGEWNAGNLLRSKIGFTKPEGTYENVYFRNPGESSVLNTDEYKKIGGTDLVRLRLRGTGANPMVLPVLEKFGRGNGVVTGSEHMISHEPAKPRKKRSQVINFLSAKEAGKVGLDTKIKDYNRVNILDAQNNLSFTPQNRINDFRLEHHISEITVTEASGQRYVYGIPVLNRRQVDYTFTVANSTVSTQADLVNTSQAEQENLHTGQRDGYLQKTETPPYASAFLLSGLLSPDYVDVDDNGISENDMGTAVKFNYSMSGISKWRTPLTSGNQANFNAGKRTEVKDDKGVVSYGERETWYLHSIESKTMIAFFRTGNRDDAKGCRDEYGGINSSDNSAQKLERIDLYSKADLKANGLAAAKPVKSVHFEYSYNLCKHVPGNPTTNGKLTLEKIYFTFNGQTRASKNQYIFSYGDTPGDNPDYQLNASDRWGTYKPVSANPPAIAPLKNADYPYSIQDPSQTTQINQNAGAWLLKKILLPSGGIMQVTYESDDYAFVQNKRAATMMQVLGFGRDNQNISNQLFTTTGLGIDENLYAFIKVPVACNSSQEVFDKYLDGFKQLCFRIAVIMPGNDQNSPAGNEEFMTVYANFSNAAVNYGIYSNDPTGKTIWVKFERSDDKSPLSLSAVEFLREQLPGQAYPGYDVSDDEGLEQVGAMFAGWFDGIKSAFSDPVNYLRGKGYTQVINPAHCFVRLNDPDGTKYGGGHRVKSVLIKDRWKKMTGNQSFESVYGQVYEYTTTEIFKGQERTTSSGVASYEPSMGAEENPFTSMMQVSNKLPMGPASYSSIELPVLDAFFPAPNVGYSKVTVRSIKKNHPNNSAAPSRSGVGRQVTEFYTAKDFPVYFNHTDLDPYSDFQSESHSFGAFFYKYTFDSRAISQGFIIELNDMHGKMKSQTSYSEKDDRTAINFTENFYRNTGRKGLDEKFDFVHGNLGGQVLPGNMGIDVELMTDVREFAIRGTSFEIQAQLDLFPVVVPFWLPFIWPVDGNADNFYRAVTCTKVVNYHSIVDRVVVVDKGSEASTENLVYDAETGSVIVNRTNNQYKQPIYTTNYPAYWAYSGMGPAYKNIDAVYSGVKFVDGKIVSGVPNMSVFESGDELLIKNVPSGLNDPCAVHFNNGSADKLWAFDKNKNASGLTNTTPDFYFMDKDGKLYSKENVSFRIIRSGKRNILGANAGSAVTYVSPIINGNLQINNTSKVVNATAVEYREKWQTDNSVFKKLRYEPVTPLPELIYNGNFSSGNNGFATNYVYSATLGSTPGKYYVGTSPQSWNNAFYACSDHSSGSGNMLMVNGVSAQTLIWSQTVNVQPNKVYIFSAYSTRLSTDNFSAVEIKINNADVEVVGLHPNSCSWKHHVSYWNSGTSTTATIQIFNRANSGNNDFGIDDISMIEDPCPHPLTMVLDCNGFLEKNINPYLKGLLGTFRTNQSKVFYGKRAESNSLSATNLPVNGMLQDFELYWNFNAENNLVPNTSGNGWVWTSQVSRINSKGLEIETKDALGIYTSAQYGFNGTMPVAIASNSPVQEMFNEGFEDYSYNELLNVPGASCNKKHIEFENADIVSLTASGINAHSGSKVLRVSQGEQVFTLNAGSTPASDFNLPLQTLTAKSLNTPGGNFEVISYENPSGYQPSQPVFTNLGMEGHQSFNIPPSAVASFYYKTTQYFEVTVEKSYHVLSSFQMGSDFSTALSYDFDWEVRSVIDNLGVAKTNIYNSGSGYSANSIQWLEDVICLKPGKYVLECSYRATQFNWGSCNTSNCNGIGYHYKVDFVEPFTSYKNTSTVNSCSFTKPIPATKEMMNPVFTMPTEKKMLISTWVKQQCAVPCTATSYTGTKVRLQYEGGGYTEISPAGPIIDGWQKIEGEFTVPSGSTTLLLKFLNNTGQPVYFDDIRVHPYNANMKSYAYDPINLRLVAEMDANNYAKFYEYDEEGTLIRTKAETKEGIKTLTETRSAKQTKITDFNE